MRIVNIHPGILPIPPDGWGAVEKIIWEYHNHFLKRGWNSVIEYLDYCNYQKGDIVHIHVANLAIEAHAAGIPYFFTMHDHHAVIYDKSSPCYLNNYEAIKNSIHSFVPAKYLIERFGLDNVSYLSHGVDLNTFFPGERPKDIKLLCVANNGFQHDQAADRKGFGFAIEAAKRLGLPITIAGPKNNEEFFNKHQFDYDKLTILYDVPQVDLPDLYREHSIFIAPSIIEAGHPNLTLLEAIACGLPVLSTFEDNNDVPGIIKIDRDIDCIVYNLEIVMNDYDSYRLKAIDGSKLYSWENIGDKLIDYYNEYMKNSDMKKGWDAAVYREIMEWGCYECDKDAKIEDDDFVVDLGCSKGYLYFKYKDLGIDYIGVDSDLSCLKIFTELLKRDDNPKIYNFMLGEKNTIVNAKSMFNHGYENDVAQITFQDLFRLINQKIDFLKFDIESFEFLLFDDPENYKLFKKCVRKFCGEIHFRGALYTRPMLVRVLEKLKNDPDLSIKLFSINGTPITELYWEHKDYYNEILVSGRVLEKNRFKEIYDLVNINPLPSIVDNNAIIVSYDNVARVEVLGKYENEYNVEFIDRSNNSVIHKQEINNNMWISCNPKYFIPWKIDIRDKKSGNTYVDILNLKNKNVKIINESSALGDSLAFFQSVVRFQKKHDCYIDYMTAYHDLFDVSDNERIVLHPYGGSTLFNPYATYRFGIMLENNNSQDKSFHKTKYQLRNLQDIASEILGVDFEEERPTLVLKNYESNFSSPYVCISTQSTSNAKFWNFDGGWQRVVDYLHEKGIQTVCLDLHDSFGNSDTVHQVPISPCIRKLGKLPLQDRMTDIYNCSFFIGLSSGLSWLAWSLNKPVMMISGFTKPFNEFYTPYRIINENVCNGCWNDPSITFDRGNWNWCPRNKDFECTRKITFEEHVRPVLDQMIEEYIQ